MTGQPYLSGLLGTCLTCGKRSYVSKRSAKRAARRLYPADHMSPYRCGDVYRIGHLPMPVRDGREGRTEVRERRRSS